MMVETRRMAEEAGLSIDVLSAGGTHNYEIMGAVPGITEVCAGAYALMDSRYTPLRPALRPAARIMATVTSRPERALAITDTGQKAVGADTGLAALDINVNATLKSLSAEHGSLALHDDEAEKLKMGDQVWYIPSDIGTCANLYDYMHAVRGGQLESVWQVTGRGLYR
jgi:D-serine deaminase-like pyridoxal phosphate-dependent protein